MSYSRDGETFGCLVFASFVIIPIVVAGAMEESGKKIAREAKTKPVLEKAHESAVSAIDTINYNDIVIDTKSARKDSVQATKQMYKIMGDIYEYKTKRFFDYVQDSIPIKSEYTRTVNTIVDTINNDTTRIIHVTISHHKTVHGASPQFNLQKAMTDSTFATTYNKYYESIKQLEIARRQQKSK